MLIRNSLFLAFLFFFCSIHARENMNFIKKANLTNDDGRPSVVDNLLSVEFLLTNTGLRYERKLAPKHVVEINGGLSYPFNFSFSKTITNGVTKTEKSAYIAVLPHVGIAYRFYYNLDRRIDRGKITYANSANYITILSSFGFAPIYSNYPTKFSFLTTVGPAWGLHRTYIKSNMDINFNIGLGYGYNNGSGSNFSAITNFTFGYVVIPKHKKEKPKAVTPTPEPVE